MDDRPLRAAARPPLPDEAPADPGRYRLFPSTPLPHGRIGVGLDALADELAPALQRGGSVRLDGGTGVLWESLRRQLSEALTARGIAAEWIDVGACLRSEAELDALLAPYLGDHPVFGTVHPGDLRDLFDPHALQRASQRALRGPTIAYGPGAALLDRDAHGERPVGPAGRTEQGEPLLAYVEVPKNEVQYRARAGSVTNLGAQRAQPPKATYKRFYFVDWPLTRRHLASLLPDLDLFVDAQRPERPTCLRGETLRDGLEALALTPFRPRPWFEPGAWGGHALERLVPELPRDAPNHAWSFELIAPENGVLLEAGGALLEVPFDLLMTQERRALLGDHAERFPELFPIRFDFLDTMGGGNLSLQCHPAPAYIRERFGEPFTQDETYYLLDTTPGSEVYLGFREQVDPEAFRDELERSARDGREVDVRKHVQAHPAAKHDLFLIPHGTVHCSGAGNLVLEISATPYIFTFKLYDWLRLDLDGTPRPLDLEHGFANLDFTRRGEGVRNELISRPTLLAETDGGRVEHLPTHPLHFYDVHRLTVAGELEVETGGSVHVLSLVEGEAVELSVDGRTRRFYFAETVVVPAAVERYRVRPVAGPVRVVKAFLKS